MINTSALDMVDEMWHTWLREKNFKDETRRYKTMKTLNQYIKKIKEAYKANRPETANELFEKWKNGFEKIKG